MRIVHLIAGLEVGGAETMLLKMVSGAKEFSPDEQHVVVSLRTPGAIGPKLKAVGVPVLSLGLEPGKLSLTALFRLKRIIKESRPDILHCWMYHAMLTGAMIKLLSPLSKYRIIWNVRDSLQHREAEGRITNLIVNLNSKLTFLVNTIVFNSHTSQMQHALIGYDSSKAVLIPNGFDTKQFSPAPEASGRLRGILGVDDDIPIVGVVGRFHLKKGFEYFIKAMSEVLAKHKAHVVMIGEGLDSSNQELMGWVKDVDLTGKISLLGLRLDISELLPGFSVFVNSSTNEAFANVLGEAMSCSVPCVATDVGDSKRILGECGLVVCSRDPSGLAKAILQVLTETESRRHQMGRCGRQRVVDNYSIAAIVKRYSALYSKVYSGHVLRN